MRDLFGCETMECLASLRLLGRGVDQKRWHILRHIPMDEGWTGATHLSEGREAPAFPEGMSPQAVQFFDLAIVLRLGDGQEDQFDAQRQT